MAVSMSGLDLSFMKENPLPDEWRSLNKPKASSRRRGNSGIISDTMDGMFHPANGKMYDSKSRFRDETRARGCIEVGNEVQVDRVDRSLPSGLREEINRVWDDLSSRR